MLPLAILFWKDKYRIRILYKYFSLTLIYKRKKVKLDPSLCKPSAN